ncbi:metalloprotease [Niallia circulans]|uniref:rRNA maturation RNase YbeY n=1 Tax=Niallia TaxID=2837506 RepID=UPI00077CB28F|nr:rRNA maturation RNase YbeY [Niallia circulans]MDR4314345.1 rRNA maturation RNase YbeY [Niallia circulans]MED3839429.1 rRNA maturation RNase YbeY [Niallia circulans]MED4242501.1 rRNA maturation RNase YbeY [Niallia circulans]MED4246479.1 rRNA maturation RNase YbeY [Niallia circulans]PAE11758.1 rRNA maturation RNase YbeY [Niallia circulans]
MNLEIDFIDETEKVKESEIAKIEKLLQFAAGKLNLQGEIELSITFVHNEQIKQINKEYREKDQPTDVISFALEELGEGELELVGEGLPRMLGDIVISIDKAEEQANDYGHSYMRELGFLSVHGFLHLLGYDHMTEEDEKVMFTLQKDILDEFGLQR